MHYGIETVKGAHFRRVTLRPNTARARPAGQGRHPDADRVSQSHVARAARRLDPGSPARHAAGRSAARRAVAAGEPTRPAGEDAAGEARAAPRESDLLRLPRRDGSARVRAGELQRGGAVPRATTPTRWRLIDTGGQLPDGTSINGPDDLRRALVDRPDHQFVQALTENLMTYALGRSLDYRDMPTVRRIVRQAAADNYRFKSIVLGVVSSDAFRKREADSVVRRRRPR